MKVLKSNNMESKNCVKETPVGDVTYLLARQRCFYKNADTNKSFTLNHLIISDNVIKFSSFQCIFSQQFKICTLLSFQINKVCKEKRILISSTRGYEK